MNPFKLRHIVIGLIVVFILFLFYRIGDDDYSYANPRPQSQVPTQSHKSYPSLDSERAYPYFLTGSLKPSSFNRHEILKAKVKGYREQTYWGEETSIDEKVRHMNDDEFDRFIEKVEENDADVYWGATYKE